MNKRIFFVLGMHRCGTSFLAQVLSYVGLNLPKTIQSGATDNPKGHFESLRFTEIHSKLLKQLGSSWETFIPLSNDWISSDAAKAAFTELNSSIDNELVGNHVVLKDPRLSILMPLWQKVCAENDIAEYYIIPLRHPRAVFQSLYQRNKIGRQHSLSIWLNYFLHAEYHSRGRRRSFVVFPDWVENIERAISKIENDLGVHFPENKKENVLGVYREFDDELVHYNNDSFQESSSFIENICESAYKQFICLCEDPEDSNAINIIDNIRNDFKRVAFDYHNFNGELLEKIEHENDVSGESRVALDYKGFELKLENALARADYFERKHKENMLLIKDIEKNNEIRINRTEDKLKKLSDAIEDYSNTEKKLQCRIEELTNQIDLLRSDSLDKAEEINELLNKCNVKDGDISLLNTKVDELTISNALLSTETEVEIKQLVNKNIHNEDIHSSLEIEIDELKYHNSSLNKEYDALQERYRREKLSVFRPLFRIVYKNFGTFLRKIAPQVIVERIKKFIPNPDGIHASLNYSLTNEVLDFKETNDISKKPSGFGSDVFIFSIINWHFRQQRPQHIAKSISTKSRRVFYIEMDMVDGACQIVELGDNIYRVRLPFNKTGFIPSYTGHTDSQQEAAWVNEFYRFCDKIHASSFKQVIIQHPFWWQLTRHFSPEFQIIVDCMDDISGFSNTESFLIDLEKEMHQKCDRLIVSSQRLFDKNKTLKKPILIRNAAEISHFDKDKINNSMGLDYAINTDDDVIKIGYVGAIAEWFDHELIRNVANNNTNFEFHLCGAVTIKEAAELSEIDNIFMHGEIPYSEVPVFLNRMDVLIIPFKIIPIIQACDPVKFYEYSSMGKPTVSTPLPELTNSDLVFIARDADSFTEMILRANDSGKDKEFRKKLRSYAISNTWEHRANQFVSVLEDVPRVSVVILSYGDPELTKGVIYSLCNSGGNGVTYPNLEIIVVDNGSSETALNIIKDFIKDIDNTKLIENGENLGFAKGNNVGINAATGDYLMLLNNDTVVAPGAIYSMVRHLQNNKSIGVVGPLTNNIGNEAKLFVEYENMEQMQKIARRATTGYRGRSTPIDVVAYFAVMFRRADLDDFGLLPEEYGLGMFEDDDHCAIIKSKGYSRALAEDAFVHHHLSASFSKMKNEKKEALFNSNKEKFEKKWGGWNPHKYREQRPLSTLSRGSDK